MTVQEQQRRNQVVLKIRELQDKKNANGGLTLIDDSELMELQTEANQNDWMYW